MEITIRPRNFKLSEDLETQIRKRVDRLTRHLDNLESGEVLLTQEPTHYNAQRLQHIAQVTLRTRNNSLIRSEVADSDLLTAVDQAIDRLTRQIERFKGRFHQRRKGKMGVGKSSAQMMNTQRTGEGPSVVEMASPAETGTDGRTAAQAVAADNPDEVIGEIVRVKQFNIKPMYPDDAIEEMELLGHNFYVFYNAGEDRLNVLYRRRDGNYGLLQPEMS
jgi:putative sigma-54 modulation protein